MTNQMKEIIEEIAAFQKELEQRPAGAEAKPVDPDHVYAASKRYLHLPQDAGDRRAHGV